MTLRNLLLDLLDGSVEFILVGMLAAVAQGVPVMTHDADIVHRRTEVNVDRLLAVLGRLDASTAAARRTSAMDRDETSSSDPALASARARAISMSWERIEAG